MESIRARESIDFISRAKIILASKDDAHNVKEAMAELCQRAFGDDPKMLAEMLRHVAYVEP